MDVRIWAVPVPLVCRYKNIASRVRIFMVNGQFSAREKIMLGEIWIVVGAILEVLLP